MSASRSSTTSPWVIRPQSLIAPAHGPRRMPPRPAGLREPDYIDKFDERTVLYDVFRCGRDILAVGPPAVNLEGVIANAVISDARGRTFSFRIERGLDRVGRFWSRDPAARGPCTVQTSLSAERLTVGDDLADAFSGRRVVMTESKNNDLEWISDWGTWYSQRHGADAIVVYDNGSTLYSLEDLWFTIATIPGIRTAAVVDWGFPFGPIGQWPTMMFDSDYAQHGALEHARWRLLRRSYAVLGVDVDELVADPDGRSVFDAAAALPSGVLQLPGVWTYPAPGTPVDRRPRHADSFWIKLRPPDAPSPPKWCAVPSRIPRESQLTIHAVTKCGADIDPAFKFWHLLSISTNWAGGRTGYRVESDHFVKDEELERRHAERPMTRPPSNSTMPSVRARLRYLPRRAVWWIRRLGMRLSASRRRRRSAVPAPLGSAP